MRKISVLLVAICAGLVAVQPGFGQTPGVKLVSSGEFTDRDGAVHTWRINGAHTLMWDGQPYMPIGGVFYSKYVCLGQTDENWQADVGALDLIKTKGITDLLLRTIGPVTWTKPEAWQKLLDYLDSSGFSYGIDFADGPKAPLDGFVIEPTRYRMADILKDASLSFDMPDVTSAIWMLCSSSDGEVLATGGASVADGKVRVQVKAKPGRNCVLLLYPTKELSEIGPSGVADLWSGFDEFRDRLLRFLSGVKFGRGLRFFADPLASKMDFAGELESLIPNSADFRLEFEAYLAKKYLNIGSLNSAWGLTGDNLESFEEAARLVPLWRGSRGIPAAYDRARGQRYAIDAPRSRIWDDVRDFRDTSAQNYLNAAADLLKRHAANVPVIYKASRPHRVFANGLSRGGFDGLGVEAYGRGENLVTEGAGQIYPLAEESARSMWYIVTGTQDTPRRDKPAPGYANKNALLADLDSLAEVGAKGIFVLGLQVLPDDVWKNHSLVHSPEQLDWLKEFKDRFSSADRPDFVPRVVYYPAEPIVGAEVKRLAPRTWWLPSLRIGVGLNLGEGIGGYTLRGQDGICMWSRTGPTTATFPVLPGQQPALAYPAGAVGVISVAKNRAVLKLTDAPVLVTGLDPLQVFPLEVIESEIAKLGPLLARAKAAGLSVSAAESAATRARDMVKSGRLAVAYDIAHTFVQQVSQDLGTYGWVEGEQAISHSFDGIRPGFGASGGGYLDLDMSAPPPMAPYSAAFSALATKESAHEIWMAGTGPEAGCSPFSYCIDDGPWQQAAALAPTRPYWNDFSWFKIGSADLTKGGHWLQIRVDGPGSGGHYKLAIDAIVISPEEFKPDGIRKP